MIDDQKLIAEIKSHPLLYDPGVPENRDINAKESTWTYIAKTLGYTVRECKMRWKSLRERFARERKKIIMNNQGDTLGSDEDHDADSLNKPGNWHLMKDMYFLWNFVFHRNMNKSGGQHYQDDHPSLQLHATSMSAPIWLLPNVSHSNILQSIQAKPADETSSDCGPMHTSKVKDPLSDDEDNSLCYAVESSDTEDEPRVAKRQHEDSRLKSHSESAALKKYRRDHSSHPSSPAATSSPLVTSNTISTSHHSDLLVSNERFNRCNVVVMNENKEKTNVYSSNSTEDNCSAGVPTESNEREVKAEDNYKVIRPHIISNKCGCQCKVKEQTEDELFCSSIAASMERLTAKQRALLKLQIQKALYEIEYPD